MKLVKLMTPLNKISSLMYHLKLRLNSALGEQVWGVQLRKAAVFKWDRSDSYSEIALWTEPWLKASLLVYFFLALGKHVCWNSQQSAPTHGGLTLRLLRLPHMDASPHGPIGPPAATTAPCPWEGQRICWEDVCVWVFVCCAYVCRFVCWSLYHLSGYIHTAWLPCYLNNFI